MYLCWCYLWLVVCLLTTVFSKLPLASYSIPIAALAYHPPDTRVRLSPTAVIWVRFWLASPIPRVQNYMFKIGWALLLDLKSISSQSPIYSWGAILKRIAIRITPNILVSLIQRQTIISAANSILYLPGFWGFCQLSPSSYSRLPRLNPLSSTALFIIGICSCWK